MRISGRTRTYGILGYPVGHSLSPVMQNAAFAQMKFDAAYLPFEVRPEDLRAALDGVRALGIAGVNVTIPHKEAVLAYLDDVDPEAAAIGAVNTVVNRDGRLIGYNTDGAGFLAALKSEARFVPKKRNVLILGAGGAARGSPTPWRRRGPRALSSRTGPFRTRTSWPRASPITSLTSRSGRAS